jgi:radical SAM superfamily enzyme YgiQ (UPF0313 family)
MLKVCMIEACGEREKGSIGAFYVREHARRSGYDVDVLDKPKNGYDVELVSVHHVNDFERVARMKQRASIRIIGGHPTFHNPRPLIPFADAICVGEGETWIKTALPLLDSAKDVGALADLPGTILRDRWEPGSQIPDANTEKPLPNNPPYLNRPGTRSAAWYVEMARGCPFSCDYCGLGHAVKYRHYKLDHLKIVLDKCDTSLTRKINFYAPDEASHPQYMELMEYLRERGFAAGFASMRVDSVLKYDRLPVLANMLVRVGVDGMSEAIRQRVNKPISDDMLCRYFRFMVDQGHCQFKMFQIFGYPWETAEDFACFEALMQRILATQLTKNVSLRIKWTPFIPQPKTPLANASPNYDHEMVCRIEAWHAYNRRPRSEPGWFVENDGIMSAKNHARQVRLTRGTETSLLQLRKG